MKLKVHQHKKHKLIRVGKTVFAIVAIVLLASCKSKAVLAEAKAKEVLPADSIIKNHYKNKKDFTTLYVKASAHYEDEDNTQNVNAEIKIKKDEKILISIRVLGITMAKALITPTEVKYYEKIGGKYFEGDYRSLSRWLGSDLDFQKVQNLLIGQALDDLNKGNYKASIDNKMYRLENSDSNIMRAFYFEAGKFLIKQEQIIQSRQNRMLKVNYPNYSEYPQAALPSGINIEASQPKGKIKINIDYNSATFNEEMSFPYSVPEGYERITID
jgi:outer membrane biogenesis lipoprotein LolB